MTTGQQNPKTPTTSDNAVSETWNGEIPECAERGVMKHRIPRVNGISVEQRQ